MTRKPMMNKGRKPSFFKVLIGDFSKRLLIPPEFTKNLVWNGIFSHKCALRGPSGLLCAVEVESTENGMFFQNGWKCFVKDHHLELGDFLIFRYDGESKFSFTIYDRSACEKDVEIAKRRSGSSVSLKNTRNHARVKVEVLDGLVAESFKNINSEDETVVSDEECCNDVKLGKRPANSYLEETSDDKSCSSQRIHPSNFPSHQITSAQTQSHSPSSTLPHTWLAPPQGIIKVNLDGVWNSEDNSAGTGVIARDSEGNLVSGAASSISAQSSIEAEAKAALEALSLAQTGNFSGVIFESDS
ncbi:hypothetical protein ACLB2K_050597 [Fragaria x ananassa]